MIRLSEELKKTDVPAEVLEKVNSLSCRKRASWELSWIDSGL